MTQYNSTDWPSLPPYHLLADDLTDYQQFLSTKMATPKPVGFDVPPQRIRSAAFRAKNPGYNARACRIYSLRRKARSLAAALERHALS